MTEKYTKSRIRKILHAENIYAVVEFQAAVERGEEPFGWYFMPIPTSGGVGVSDFVCCINGRYVEIEAKWGANKMSRLQALHKEHITISKGVHMVFYPTEQHEKALGKIITVLRGAE